MKYTQFINIIKHLIKMLTEFFKSPYFKITLFSLLAIISAGWIGDALKGDCLFTGFSGDTRCSFPSYLASLFFSLTVFFIVAAAIYKRGQKLLFYRNLQSTPGVMPHKVLIMAVSTLTPAPPRQEPDGRILLHVNENEQFETTGDIEKDINFFTELFNEKKIRYNTQQLLRAVKPHLKNNTLQRIYLIGSEDSVEKKHSGSYHMLCAVSNLLHLYDKNLKIKTHGGIDFKDVKKLHDEYEKLISEAKQEFNENDIILDTTGGLKTTSIAAAITTFKHKELKFQYVETNGQEPEPWTFNIVVESPEKIL